MKKILIAIIFISMASIAIAQCPGSKAEEYKRKLQEHNSKTPREKAELPGMLGQAYSQAASYYMYKCMCENGYAKNDQGKQEIADAANASAGYFNSANISGEPKLSKINASNCTMGKKGAGGNETANYVNPEKGLFFNNSMMSNLNAIAAESDNEELKTIVKEMNEVHQKANYMRQNYGLDQGQTEMLNTWENIGQIATVLVANSIKKDQEYFERLEQERKNMERLADNMSYGKAVVIHNEILKVIDSLRVEYLYPLYLSKNPSHRKYLLKGFDRAISSYYPITHLYREMIQHYYVGLNLNNNYKVNMQRYPWETQKDKFLEQYEGNGKQSWRHSVIGSSGDRVLIDLLHLDHHTAIWDRKTVMDELRHNKLLTDEQRKSIMERKERMHPEDFNIIPYSHYGQHLKESSNLDTLLLYAFLDKKQIQGEQDYKHPNEYYEYMYPIWITNRYKQNALMSDLINKYQEVVILGFRKEYPPIASLGIRSFSDFEKLSSDDIRKLKMANITGPYGKLRKYFSNSKLLLRLTGPMVTFANLKAGNLINMAEYQLAMDVTTGTERQLINLYEVSKSEIIDAFSNRYLSSDDKEAICFDYQFFHRYFQLRFFKLDAEINLKQYESAKKTLQEINKLYLIDYSTLSSSLIYTPFPRLFSFDSRVKFYPIYLTYLETGKLDKKLFYNTFDDRLKILNLIEEWQVTHSDIEPVLQFLN